MFRIHIAPIRRFRTGLSGLPALLGAVLGVWWFVVTPTFGTDFSRIPGDFGDARLNNYLLEHGYQCLMHPGKPFWDAPFFYPHKNVVAYSDNYIGSAPFYLLPRLFLDRESAFQAWIVIGYVLNFIAAAWVLRRLSATWIAAAIGAAIFAFSITQQLRLGHAQLLWRFPVPLTWYFFDRFVRGRELKALPIAAALVCWQFYLSPYLAYFLVLVLSAYGVACIIRRELSVDRRAAPWVVGSAAVAVLMLSPALLHYLSAPSNDPRAIADLLPQPKSYLLGSRGDVAVAMLGLANSVDSTMPWEHWNFVGFLPLACVFGALALVVTKKADPLLTRVLLALAIVVGLTIKIDGHSPYSIVTDLVPAVAAFRVMTRIVMVLLLLVSIVSALVIDAMLKASRFSTWQKALFAVCVVVFMLWENRVATPVTFQKAQSQTRIAAIVSSVAPRITGGSVLAVMSKSPEPWYYANTDAMMAAQQLGIPTINGHSRVTPAGFRELASCEALPSAHDIPNLVVYFGGRECAERTQ
jgi:hypothetical protein